MGGVVLDTNYPFEIEQINPIYLTETDVRNKIEQMISALLAIIDDQ